MVYWYLLQPRPQGAFSFSPCVKVRSPGNEDGIFYRQEPIIIYYLLLSVYAQAREVMPHAYYQIVHTDIEC